MFWSNDAKMKTTEQIIDELKSRYELSGGKQFSVIKELLSCLKAHDCNKDGYSHTVEHARRSSKYLDVIYDEMIVDSYFGKQLSKVNRAQLIVAGQLHDIGKLCVPKKIINSNRRLAADEIAIMESHCSKGAGILGAIMQDELIGARMSESEKSAFQLARDIAVTHHKHWDGTGYPSLAIAGENIPLVSRMMAIPDVYDALVSERSYKSASSHEIASELIVESSGSRFDPRIVKVFEMCQGKFKILKESFEKDYKKTLSTMQQIDR